jgi:hypothetical protein
MASHTLNIKQNKKVGCSSDNQTFSSFCTCMFIFTRILLFQEAAQETISIGRKNTKIIKYINKHKIHDKQNYVFAGQCNLHGEHDVYCSVLDVLKNYACTVKKVVGFPVLSLDVTNQTLPGGE